MTEKTQDKTNYKATLNLPKTAFPMRANLAQNEPQSMKRWAKMDLYKKVNAARDGRPRFTFHDGPPYANASIHTGHLLNKVLKDFVVRTRVLMGRHCPYVPGWDCHGLPIEHRVMTQLNESGKLEKLQSLDEDTRRMAVRRECQKYASKYVKHQAGQMQRLLTLADYDDPYLTMSKGYERDVLNVFADLVEQGLVYRALKPVHWSIANETALAEAELEYEEREDPSIYVDFEATDRGAVGRAFGLELDATPSFMIWTTTPWTLPANLAIAVNPRFRYALAEIDGNVTVLASDRVEKVAAAAKAERVDVLAETDGSNLVGLVYRHPFAERTGPIVAAEYVTLDDGTGLVHTAPGHGQEDYQTGLREGLDIYCPVRADGTYDDTVPEWLRGRSIWDANTDIVEHLRRSGHLFFDHRFTHSYPHDWRSRTPVIFRATEQWFVGVDQPTQRDEASLRDLALHATAQDVRFIPEWGRNRMRGMLESRPDWCLSRQRAWGLPIPAFETPEGEVLLTAASVRAVAEAFGQRGADAWFTESPEQLLETYDPSQDPDAPQSFKAHGKHAVGSPDVSRLRKMHDIFDVWFESGSSWNAVLRARDLGYPADLYLEGSDQHRGWFQLSLLPALGVTGQSPFKALLTHGFTLDKNGRKMSKSLGNALDVDELLKHFGADVCRWWVSSLAYENDIKVDLSFFELAGESYRKVRNTLRFLLSNLNDFDRPADGVDLASIDPTSMDAYVLQEAARVQRAVLDAYERYAFRAAHQALYDFCNETLSAFYLDAAKDRLYCDRPDSTRRRRTQTVIHAVLESLCRLLAPIMPHTADEAYRTLHGEDACVHLDEAQDFPFDADRDWPTVLAARDRVLKALEEAKGRGIENPLDAEVLLPDSQGVLRKFAADLPDVLGVSRVQVVGEGEVVINDLRDEPRCERSWKRDGTVKRRENGSWLTDRDAEAVGVA